MREKGKEVIKDYEILAEFPFDSDRKRMSLIVKEIETGKIYIYCKGADSVMVPLITMNPKELETINDHLYKFATRGFRTLVMGMKKIS